MNFKRCLPLTPDLLLNANERTQQHHSKCIMDPLKRETNAKRKTQDRQVLSTGTGTGMRWNYEVDSIVDCPQISLSFLKSKHFLFVSISFLTIGLVCAQQSKQQTLRL